MELREDQIQITYKYRIYPNKTQEKLLWSTVGICRKAYNLGLQYSIERKTEGIKTSRFDISNYFKQIKESEDYQYFGNLHSQVLQNVSDRIMKSYNMFFKTKNEFPKFKSFKKYTSFTYPQSGFKIREDGKKLKLSGIGEVKLKYHRQIVGKIKTCTIKRNKCNQWFVCFSVIQTKDEFFKQPKETGRVVGIDLGLEKLITLSEGTYFDHPHFYKKSLKKIKKRSRNLSKKKLGSKNRNKARVSLAKAHLKVYNQRQDFLFKLANYLVNHYQVIGLENVSPQFMIKNHKLAQSISDASWSMLKSKLDYASYKYQTILGLVDPKNTSQLCSNCGTIVKKDLSVRIHRCNNCGLVMDRDLNAAINILNRIPDNFKTNMKIQIPMEDGEFTLTEIRPLLTLTSVSKLSR